MYIAILYSKNFLCSYVAICSYVAKEYRGACGEYNFICKILPEAKFNSRAIAS